MRLRWLAPLAGAFMVGCGYNTIQSKDERAAEAKQQIEVQLQRRSDLIGNLVNTVKRYAEHEAAVFTSVADARSRVANAVRSGDPAQMAEADAQLTGALGRLIAVAENYPTLKADALFLRLAGSAGGDGEPHRGRADRLQRSRAGLQQLHPAVPAESDREGDGSEGASLLRGGRGCGRRAARGFQLADGDVGVQSGRGRSEWSRSSAVSLTPCRSEDDRGQNTEFRMSETTTGSRESAARRFI